MTAMHFIKSTNVGAVASLRILVIVLAVCACAGGVFFVVRKLGNSGQLPAVAYPGKQWEARSPEEVGLQSASLEQLANEVEGDGFISRNGYEVYSWGNPRRKRN